MNFNKKLWKDFPFCDIISLKYDLIKIGCDVMEYKFQNKEISNGIELCSITAKGFKSASVTVNFVMPLSQKASLYALVPNVLSRSSEEYPDLTSIERKLAVLYGAELSVDVSKSGDHQVLKLGVSCIDDRFAFDGESITAECSKLLFEIIFKPRLVNGVFDVDDVESEKRLLSERLAAEKSDKRAYAKNRCEEIMFQGDVYGIHRFGSEEAIKAIDANALYEAYKEILRSAKIVVCVSGNADISLVEDYLVKYTEKLERELVTNKTTFDKVAKEVKYVKEQEEVKQGKLVLGFRMGMDSKDDSYSARRVMVDIFGGSPHSKLFTIVREKMSLCYYCSSAPEAQKGLLIVSSGIEVDKREIAEKAILDQLEAVKAGDFTADEENSARLGIINTYRGLSDSARGLESWYLGRILAKCEGDPHDVIASIERVTKEEIIAAANKATLDTVYFLNGTLKEDAQNA